MIRSASAADAAQIAAVMRDSWFAAYDGIIATAIIDRVTAPDGGARVRQSFRIRPWQRMIAAIARREDSVPGDDGAGIVGYASFGPERDVLGAPWPHPLTPAGSEGLVAELYALYVHPAWWSTGTGRALMNEVLARVGQAGYAGVTLWVLEANDRARRFYGKAGFAPDGARHLLEDLGGVTEIRYRRALGQLARRLPPRPVWPDKARRAGRIRAAPLTSRERATRPGEGARYRSWCRYRARGKPRSGRVAGRTGARSRRSAAR
jgi:GNAT superfamily N-acetyltransferase